MTTGQITLLVLVGFACVRAKQPAQPSLCPLEGESTAKGMEYGSGAADGASGFADLVGVYAPQETWSKNSAWSTGVGGSLAVTTSEQCDFLCNTHLADGCEVWTWNEKKSECWLKRSMLTSPALTESDESTTGAIPLQVSRVRSCLRAMCSRQFLC